MVTQLKNESEEQFMKKIIVAISMLLIATLALSVAAFGAPSDYGVNTYYLGNPVVYAPTVDGVFGASEYVVSYNLTSAAVYVDSSTGVSAGKTLDAPAAPSSVTSAIRVGLSYDVDYIYIGIQASLANGVSDVTYTVDVDNKTYTLSTTADLSAITYKSESTLSGTVFSGELAIPNDSISLALTVDDTYTLKITELTKDNKGADLNKSIWNAVKLTSVQKFELNTTDDYLVHSFVLGNPSSVKPSVSVSQEPIGVPTTAPVTTEPVTTEAPTTEPVTTEAPTTEAPTTEPVTTEAPTTEAPTTEIPVTEAPTTELPEPTDAPTTQAPETEPVAPEKNCKNSIGMMGIALVAALGTCAVVVTKKKED